MRRLARGARVSHFDKRGTGLSDRITRTPDLETRMDDIRAVMDAQGLERAALLGWGDGAALAALFAATYPQRTTALCMYGSAVRTAWGPDYPWGVTDDQAELERATLVETWGDEDRALEWARLAYGDHPGAVPFEDLDFLRWSAKLARYSCTPAAAEIFDRMWFETDVREVLATIHVPAIVLYRSGVPDDEEEGTFVARMIPGAKPVGIPGRAWAIWIEPPEPLAAALEEFLRSVSAEEAELDRVLATVLFTDIVQSTEHVANKGDRAWQQLLESHHRIVRGLLARYRGTEIDTAGDGFCAVFDGPARAIRCAQAIIEAVRSLGLGVRAGVHTGEVETIDGKVGGLAVHVGARIGALASVEQVLVSQTVKDLVAGSGLSFSEGDLHSLKGLPGEWRLFELTEARTP